MNLMKYDFAIIGGDLRQVYMANELIQKGYSVITYGLETLLLLSSCVCGNSLQEVMESSNNLITSIPFSMDGKTIKSQKTHPDLIIDSFFNLIKPRHKLYGGSFKKEVIHYFEENNIYYYDFMKHEETALYNSIATAEGAIAEAIINSNFNLHDSSCLILGYGRCGKTLAKKLQGLADNVDIAARSSVTLAKADAFGFGTIPLRNLEQKIGTYDIVFNTIPAIVLTDKLLDLTKPAIVIIDIASAPGGVDYEYAKKINRIAKLCLGLPGKFAPKSSATFLVNNMLSDLGKK